MITVRLMERLWSSKAHEKTVRELLSVRAEGSLQLEMTLAPRPAAAALLLIRLDELSQSYVPLAAKLVQSLVQQQQLDGGWGDPATTALCLRALLCGAGAGYAVDRGLSYLVALQKEDGSWPAEPLRRMPADAYVSAFILSQLADRPEFRDAVDCVRACEWLERAADTLDRPTRKLWELAQSRGRYTPVSAAEHAMLWA